MYTNTGKYIKNNLLCLHILITIIISDSLLYHVKADDFNKDLLENFNLMDESDLPLSHPCYTTVREKVPGFFMDEVKGYTMTEFCALRTKSYAYNIYLREDDKTRDKN